MRKIVYGILAVTFLMACNKTEDNSKNTVEVPALDAPSAIEAASAGGSNGLPTTYQTEPTAQAPVAGVKLNPPHGEPGHICEIPVGDPLPADGATTAAQPAVQAAPARPMPINPGATSVMNRPINTSVPTGPKPKFNPPHGEPWHTCDLEVGEPLT